ncbi:iron-containing alcohol dehydrogenase, partial [Peptostreptococcus porci]
MYNFIFNVDTKVLFGRGQIDKLGEEIKKYSNNVLLVYGGGSIKKNGIYDATLKTLSDNNIEVFEISGIDPNPRIETVREGVGICKKNNIGAVLAVGGGSSIDCAKVISAGTKYDGDAWDIVLNNKLITSALPVFSVLTLSAT